MKSRFGFSLSFIAPSFALSLAVGCANRGDCCETEETSVTMNELPAAVRATFEKETVGGTINEIEKETEGGKTVFSADADMNGKKWEIAVAESGELLSKKQD